MTLGRCELPPLGTATVSAGLLSSAGSGVSDLGCSTDGPGAGVKGIQSQSPRLRVQGATVGSAVVPREDALKRRVTFVTGPEWLRLAARGAVADTSDGA